ncbi:MAG TPA: DUF2336 domain-containing protein [Terriglobales bacterium]|nr:DUF2336 domain-containing protein [Terriglobales bacterium]
MGAPLALIRDLDSKIAQTSHVRRATMLRQLTDLFLVNAEQFSEDEINLIDDVFMRLVVTIEESARALLATRLAPEAKAPPKVLRLLACDDAIEVAAPVLIRSERLDTQTLIDCAKTKSQEHLLAISRRKIVPEDVNDILVARGDQQVLLSIAKNPGARLSKKSFSTLISRARMDDELGLSIGGRSDLPPGLFENLIEAASEQVKARLAAEKKYPRGQIDRAADEVASQIEVRALAQSPKSETARVLVHHLNNAGQLNPEKLEEFARTGRFEEIVAALSVMADIPSEVVERTVKDSRAESLLVLAKAVDLPWETTKSILTLGAKRFHRSGADMAKCMTAFQRLSPSTAQQILEFHRMRQRSSSTRKH